MHIPDGVLSPPVCLAAAAVSGVACAVSLRRLRRAASARLVPLTGMVAALVFAGQMVNFPLGLFGIPAVSGHVLGGVLAAAVVGPWAGCLAVTLVLLVQCLVFADGGLLALGANVLNMAVIGALGGSAVLATVRRLFGPARPVQGTIVGSVVAAWVSVLAAAAAFCLEFRLGAGGGYDFGSLFALMVSLHAAIGVVEAAITGSVVAFVVRRRPELLLGTGRDGRVGGQVVGAGVLVALALAAFVAPFASTAPDGLEAVRERHFPALQAGAHVGFLDGYEVPAPLAGWRGAPVWRKVSVSLAGGLGTLATVGLASALLAAVRPRRERAS